MFSPLDIPSEYWPEHVTFRLLCVIFKFPTRIFYRRVPGFATDCPCGVWCRRLTTCLLYVGPPFGILVWNDSGYVSLTQWWYFFHFFKYGLHISTPNNMIFCFPLPYFPFPTSALFLLSTLILTFYIDVVLTLFNGSVLFQRWRPLLQISLCRPDIRCWYWSCGRPVGGAVNDDDHGWCRNVGIKICNVINLPMLPHIIFFWIYLCLVCSVPAMTVRPSQSPLWSRCLVL